MSGLFWFILFLFIVAGIIGTMIYFLLVKSTTSTGTAFKWWGLGASVYILIGGIVMFGMFHVEGQRKEQMLSQQRAKETYTQVAQKAASDPDCKTARQKCLESSIQMKKANDLHRPDISALERAVQQSPTDTEVSRQLAEARASLARDVNAISSCDKESSTNKCIENVIAACSDVVATNPDARTREQFLAFKQTRPAPEVLNFCRTVT